jgi:plasmid replication initiation protein
MGEIDRNASVVKRNELISMSYKLSINEQRLLLGCISQIDSRKELDRNTEFQLVIKDMVDLFNLGKTSAVYEHMKTATQRLFKRSLTYREGTTTTSLRWVYKIQYEDESGTIRLWFSPDIIPYLTLITKSFTRYKLRDVSRFKHIHSIRIYELCAQWKQKGFLELTIDELRNTLSITDKYPKWSELKRNVIDKAVTEINRYSNLRVSYGVRRMGRSVHSIQFKFQTKDGIQSDPKKIPRSNPKKVVVEKKPRSGDGWREGIHLAKDALKKIK